MPCKIDSLAFNGKRWGCIFGWRWTPVDELDTGLVFNEQLLSFVPFSASSFLLSFFLLIYAMFFHFFFCICYRLCSLHWVRARSQLSVSAGKMNREIFILWHRVYVLCKMVTMSGIEMLPLCIRAQIQWWLPENSSLKINYWNLQFALEHTACLKHWLVNFRKPWGFFACF